MPIILVRNKPGAASSVFRAQELESESVSTRVVKVAVEKLEVVQ